MLAIRNSRTAGTIRLPELIPLIPATTKPKRDRNQQNSDTGAGATTSSLHDRIAEAAKSAETNEQKLAIIEDPANFNTVVQLAINALKAGGCVFRQDRSLVVADRSAKRMTRYGEKRQLALVRLNKHNLPIELTRCANFLRLTAAGKTRSAMPSQELCNAVLNYIDTAKSMNLPPLRGVMCMPFLRPDGTVCEAPGYDAATGILFDPCGVEFPSMPDITPHNARGLAEDAAWRLLAPLRGYRFTTTVQDPDADWDFTDTGRTVALSSFMTAVAVHATPTRPSYLIDAAVFGAGKTMLAELPVIMMIGDDPALLSLADDQRGTVEEFNKQLDTSLLDGSGYVILDNARGDLNRFGRLAVLQTARTIRIRLFGSQNKVDVDNNFVVMISGNNVETTDDSARRCLRARIFTAVDNPDQQQFDFDPRNEVLEDRGQLCIDALTIMRAYQVAGAPPQAGRPYGSFEQWTRIVRDPLLWLGFSDIIASNDEARDTDPDPDRIRRFTDGWALAGLSGSFTAKDLIDEVTGDAAVAALPASSPTAATARAAAQTRCRALRDVMLEVAEDAKGKYQVSPDRLGHWFKRVRDRQVGGKRIHRKVVHHQKQYEVI